MNPSRLLAAGLLLGLLSAAPADDKPAPRNFPYRELEGRVEQFSFIRQWYHYYWREDFTMLVRDDTGKTHRVISREPTPWNNLRFGTTYTHLPVDWAGRPRVRVIGVQAIDRIPVEFYDLKLDPEKTITAFIVRVQAPGEAKPAWRDFYVNNWVHDWGPEADKKVLLNYVTDDPNYTIYGFLSGTTVTFDADSKKLLEKYEPDYSGIIYHGKVVKKNDAAAPEVRLIHLMGRNKKTQNYDVFHGDPKGLITLDGNAPPEAGKK